MNKNKRNGIAAALANPCFRPRKVKVCKGRGSTYSRKVKHKNLALEA